MASRKTATSEKSTREGATAKRAGGASKAPARKTTRATSPARPAATAKKASAGPEKKASGAKATRPSARAAKKAIASGRGARAEAPAANGVALAAARVAAEAALDKKAEDVVILDVRGLVSYADYFVVASGTSDRHVTAIADAVEEKMKKAGHRTIGVEGYTRGHWVLLDFGDVVAHVFYDEARAFYDFEGLWADARRVPVG